MAIHATAAGGYDAGAESYAIGRPTYAQGAADLLARLLPERATVADVAAGTGKWTQRLLARGRNVVAVEPVGGMRQVLRREVPGISIISATAEALPLRDGALDLVTVAAAIHWFRLDEALPEVRRVLRPGGHLAVLRNVRDAGVPWVAELDAIVSAHRPEIPNTRTVAWHERLANEPELDEVEQATFANPEPFDRTKLHERVRSLSFVTGLPARQREQLRSEIDRLADGLPATFTMPYTTEVVVLRSTQRTDTEDP